MKEYNYMDHVASVSEEIQMMTGFKTTIANDIIYVDCVVVSMLYDCAHKETMKDVYRFIFMYGRQLTKHANAELIRLNLSK